MKAKATNYNVTLIQDLIVPLFGKHVNDHLSNANFQSLDQFKNQPELVNRFTELITADSKLLRVGHFWVLLRADIFTYSFPGSASWQIEQQLCYRHPLHARIFSQR